MKCWGMQLKAITVDGGGGSIVYGPKESITIASGVIAASASKRYAVSPETGVSDALTQITGLSDGNRIALYGTTGNTITVTDGATLKLMSSANCILDGPDDMIIVEGTSTAGTCREINRMSAQ